MRVALIVVPYDAGRRSVEVGRGPERLLEAGVANELRAVGHDIREVTVELPRDTAAHELARIVAIQRELAREADEALRRDELPIVLAGNCSTAVGSLAPRPPATAVIWLDAHGDFNTADTTTTGMIDGLALSMVTGRALRNLTASVRGFVPVDEARVVLVGARDLDPPEEAALAASRVVRLTAETAPATIAGALRSFGPPVPPVYVHLDLDVLDPSQARANRYEAPGGLSPAALVDTLRAVVRVAPLYALAVTAYDPTWDRDGQARQAALAAIRMAIRVGEGTRDQGSGIRRDQGVSLVPDPSDP